MDKGDEKSLHHNKSILISTFEVSLSVSYPYRESQSVSNKASHLRLHLVSVRVMMTFYSLFYIL